MDVWSVLESSSPAWHSLALRTQAVAQPLLKRELVAGAGSQGPDQWTSTDIDGHHGISGDIKGIQGTSRDFKGVFMTCYDVL